MVLDTSYLYFRAFFGYKSAEQAPDGTPINAVKGLLDSIASLLRQFTPDAIACAWDDDWRPEWRTDLIPSYKAHRVEQEVADGVDEEEVPDALGVQVPIIREVLERLGVAVIGAAQHEADDVLASLAERHDGRTLVVTGDRDLFQLVDEHTQVVYVGQGVRDAPVVDDAWLQERYGLSASRYTDFAILRGDPSDGLPGVKGIGEKSALKLVTDFPSLEAALQAALDGSAALSPAMRAKLAGATDYVTRARIVVEAVRDLELPGATDLPLTIDAATVSALEERWGLGGSLQRVVAALS